VLQTVLPSGGRAVEHPDLILPRSQINAVEQQVERARAEWGTRINVDFRAGQSSGGASGCPAGRHLLNISAEGDVSTCSWLYKISPKVFTLGNIKTDSLSDCVSRAENVMYPWTEQTSGCPIPIARLKASGAALYVHS
jgi:MoaA/NifB/PqqE/SkfB family radical SAM enzyme